MCPEFKKNFSIIRARLSVVPTTSPIIPIVIKIVARVRSNTLENPSVLYQNVAVSIMAGNASPSDERQKAPNNEMNSPRSGNAVANATGKRIIARQHFP